MKKVALITGAAGGIGAAIAEYFVQQGYHIAVTDVAANKLSELITTLEKYNLTADQCLTSAIDIADYKKVKKLVDDVQNKFGRVDVLFNGAGIARLGGSEMSPQEFINIININLIGSFNFIHEVVPIMKQQKSGYIFNVASRQGKSAGAKLAGYASSKFGVMGLSESICRELINDGIKVTALCPSYTNTPMMDVLDFPREEMLVPEDLVKTIDYLLSLSTPACVREILIEIRKLV